MSLVEIALRMSLEYYGSNLVSTNPILETAKEFYDFLTEQSPHFQAIPLREEKED